MDSKQKKKRKAKPGQIINILCYPLIGAVCGFLMVRHIDIVLPVRKDAGEFIFGLCICFFLLFAAFFLHIILHETGHLIFGRITGYHFMSFRIGKMMFLKKDGKIKLRRLSIAGTGGQCLMDPPDMKDGKIPFVLYNLGGSLVNFISALIFIGAYIVCPNYLYLSLFFLIMAVTGIGIALANGIPLRFGMVDNDGNNAVSLGKSSMALYSFWVQMKMNAQMTNGVRLKDMPLEWFYQPKADELKNSIIAVMAVFYENRLMDEHNFEEAELQINKLLSLDTEIAGLYKRLLICDKIYCALLEYNRKKTVSLLQTKEHFKFVKQMKQFPAVIRTEYAAALLYEDNTAKAECIKKRFELCAKSYPYPADIESERELMEIAEKRKDSGI